MKFRITRNAYYVIDVEAENLDEIDNPQFADMELVDWDDDIIELDDNGEEL